MGHRDGPTHRREYNVPYRQPNKVPVNHGQATPAPPEWRPRVARRITSGDGEFSVPEYPTGYRRPVPASPLMYRPLLCGSDCRCERKARCLIQSPATSVTAGRSALCSDLRGRSPTRVGVAPTSATWPSRSTPTANSACTSSTWDRRPWALRNTSTGRSPSPSTSCLARSGFTTANAGLQEAGEISSTYLPVGSTPSRTTATSRCRCCCSSLRELPEEYFEKAAEYAQRSREELKAFRVRHDQYNTDMLDD